MQSCNTIAAVKKCCGGLRWTAAQYVSLTCALRAQASALWINRKNDLV